MALWGGTGVPYVPMTFWAAGTLLEGDIMVTFGDFTERDPGKGNPNPCFGGLTPIYPDF